MDKSEFLELNLPSRDNTTDVADINAISDNFRTIDGAFLDLVEKEIPKLQTKENINLNFDDDSTNEEQYPSVPAVVNFTNRKIDPFKIINSASGNAISLKDSANDKLVGLKLYGKTIQDGTPTPTEPKELKSVGDSGSFEVGVFGKNLFNNTGVNNTLNGLTITVNADKSVTAVGTATATTTYNMGEIGGLIKGQSYKPVNSLRCRLQLTNGTITYINSYQAFTYTDEINKVYAYISFSNGVTVNATYYPTLVLATETDDTYEQYKAKQSITFTDTLRGIGDIADEKDFARAVFTRRLLPKTFNGSEQWLYHETRGFYSYLGCKVYGRILTNLYPTNSGITPIDKTASTHFGAGTYIWVKDTTYSDVDSFKSALATNPLTVVYEIEPLEAPISETELNAYRQLYTNKPNTTILSEADMEVDYIADTKLYIDNKIAELTALTLEG